MMPEELLPEHRRSMEARMRAYKNAAYCLQDFVEIYDTRETDEENAARYRYFVDMAGAAWTRVSAVAHARAMERQAAPGTAQASGPGGRGGHQGLRRHRVPDPLGAVEVREAEDRAAGKEASATHWSIVYPKVFHDEDMLIAARRQLIQCGGRPMLMGRSGAAYEALMTLTEMAERIPPQAEQAAKAS